MRIHSKTTTVRLECTLQRSGGDVFCGYTRALSRDSAEIESHSFCLPGRKQPVAGDIGLLTLKFLKNNITETVQIHSRILYMMGMTAGLEMFLTELTSSQRDNLIKILETGSEKID